MLSTEPFWRSQFPRPADLPVAPALPERVDVAIVGNGYTGLNAARVLAKAAQGRDHVQPLRRNPHPKRFFYRNEPWFFLPLAARYHRLVDWLG